MREIKASLIWSRRWRLAVLLCGVSWVALPGPAYPQERKLSSESVKSALLQLQQGEFSIIDVRILAEAGEVQAIPALKAQFLLKKETQLKEYIASALFRLGEKDQIYWDCLEENARVAVENDAPPIFLLDSQGNVMRGSGKFSPEFTEWAKAHNLDPGEAAQAQAYELPAYVAFLGWTGDQRAQPVLRRGLASRNVLIQSMAARGLAKLQDIESIPLIIEACGKVPKEMVAFIARTLVFFDDPRAQAAAETFIANKQLLEELRKHIRENGADPFRF